MSFTAKMRSPYLKERKTKFQLLAKILHPVLVTGELGMGGDSGIFALTRAGAIHSCCVHSHELRSFTRAVPIQMCFAFYLA